VGEFGPYPAVVTDWHDADTCHVNLDLGFSVFLYGHDLDGKPVLSLRAWGINAPEIATPEGKDALAYAEQLCPPGTHVTIVSHGYDKYGGRFLGTIALPDGRDFGSAMVAAGFARPYFGVGPKI
jgi:endonuclease YncB( thermonuclease family)